MRVNRSAALRCDIRARRARVAGSPYTAGPVVNGEIIADLLLAGRVLLRGLWSDGLQKRSSSLPKFPAIAHVALTVSDLDRSRTWYQRLFGSDPVLDQDTGPFHQVVWSVSGGRFQSVAATSSLNRSAGVSHPRVLRGRVLRRSEI